MPGIRKPGTHVSEDALQAYISEVEMLYIKPLVGDELYITLATDTEGKYAGLLEGCEYSDRRGNRRFCPGLKTAIAYYAYSQYVMAGDVESTRYGFRMKEEEYSSRISSKERSELYNNTLQVASGYLSECRTYMSEALGLRFEGSPKITGSFTIRKIG